MRVNINSILIFFILIAQLSCTNQGEQDNQQKSINPDYFHRSIKKLTDVIVHDIFSPPVASRIYVYPNIAAYEILAKSDTSYISLVAQLTDLKPIPNPNEGTEINFELAAIHAFNIVAKALIFSEDKIEVFQKKMYTQIRDEVPMKDDVYSNSLKFGEDVAEHILLWANEDNYKETRTFPKYTIQDDPRAWKPTPPDYMEGIEPHWNKIRPFVIDSANQFIPEPPTPFDTVESSQFFKETKEVYDVGRNLTEEQLEIAKFWDCNPYVSIHRGHAMFAEKKITPGGHWIGISSIACRQDSLDLYQSVELYTRVSIALADAFISCWDEKWRSVLVRPETVINQYIDENWYPVLQTPPFPEYTSGHSVISTAAATILTDYFGDAYFFIDTVEVEYGLPARSFNSFFEASEEAAISRLYGGIHYRPAIENGITQGRKVGEFIIRNLHTRRKEDSLQNHTAQLF